MLNNKKSVIILTVLLASVSRSSGATIITHLADIIGDSDPVLVANTGSPFKNEKIENATKFYLELQLFDEEPNQIIDEEEWFDYYNLPQPKPPKDHVETVIPSSTKFGTLHFLRKTDEWIFAVYEKIYPLDNPIDIYDEGYLYTLVVLHCESSQFELHNVYTMGLLFPDILEMCWCDAKDNFFLFNAAYNGYADLKGDSTGYLYCFDARNGAVIWSTKNLISSYRGFTVYEDYVIAGYGFTAEPDFLYVVNRFTGAIIQTIPIKTAHEHIIIKDGFCFVRTYNMNYVYKIIKSF